MIKELPNNCTGVKLPNGATDVDIFQDRIDQFVIGIDRGGQSFHIPLSPGSYTLLFTTKDKVTEEMAKEVVERVSGWEKPLYYDYCASGRDYRDIVDAAFKEALPSYHSLLRSLDMTGSWAVLRKGGI